MKPPIRFTGALLSIVMLAACARGQGGARLPAPASPTQGAEATISITRTTPIASVTPVSSIPFKDSTLVTQVDPKTKMFMLAPVDPATGQRLKGYAPIDVGSASLSYSFSPDKKTLIFVSYSTNASPIQPTLHFLNLPAWDERIIPLSHLSLMGWISAWAVSPDGNRFAIATGDKGNVLLVDTIRRRVIAQVDTAYVVNNMQFTADSSSLMIYVRQIAPDTGISQGAPMAELLSATDLNLTWSKKLENLRDGFKLNKDFTGSNIYEPGAGTLYSPGIVFSPTKDMLYIVHADVDKLTSVDFSRKSVVTVDIHPKLSWFEQFLMFSAQSVYAKGQDGIERQTIISPDGRIIYTTGMQNKFNKNSNGDWVFTQIPLNLEAISAADGVELFESKATGSNLSISSDGASVFLNQYLDSGYLSGTDEVNAITGEMIAQHKGFSLQSTHRMDGTPLLISAAPSYTNQSITDMTAFKADHALLGKWTAPDYAEWLIMP